MNNKETAGDFRPGMLSFSIRRVACRMGGAGTRACALLAFISGGVLSACTNPFAPTAGERPVQTPSELLREISAIELTPSDEAPAIDLRGVEGLESVELSLEQCRASALERNHDIRVALVSPTIAVESITREEARFESFFGATARWSQNDSPTSSTLDSAQSEFGSFEPSFTLPLRTGGSASVSLPITRSETDNQFSTLNPAYTSDLRFSLSHELLRNAGRRQTTHGIRLAAYGRDISEARTKLNVLSTLISVDRAYWQLYAQREALRVRENELELAETQLESARRRFNAQTSPEIDVVRAQAGVADRLGNIVSAREQVRRAQRELKRLINAPGLDVDSETVVVTASPPDPVLYSIDPPALVDHAMSARMEMLELEIQLAQDIDQIEYQRLQALPLLTAGAGYTINGLGGSLDDSLETTSENRFEDWNVSLTAQLPLGNRGALSDVRRAVLERLQRLASRDTREQLIRQEIYDAADAIDSNWQRILAARQSVVLQTRAFEAETRQFDAGRSTSTDVLDAATNLANAQLTEIRAIVDYQLAQVAIAQATGTLLGATKVSWEPVPTPKLGGSWYTPEP